MNDSEQLKPAFNEAANLLQKVLQNGEVDDTAKLAVQTVGAYSRLKATERAGQTLQYFVIKDFAEDNKEELKKMVQKSLPELNPQPQLP